MTDAALLDDFQAQRPLLFSIAYRMLGSASDAEDIVQDAWLRYRETSDVRSPRALTSTIVTRLCLDRLKSARAAREQYIGPWLPEPVLTDGGAERMLQRSETVTMAFLLLLEALSPEERAVFILKEAFDYDHNEIADILGVSAANSRQLLHRAKTTLRSHRPAVQTAAAGSQRAVADRFAAALRNGDAAAMTELLAQDVGLWTDGGGKVLASRRPLVGRGEVLNFMIGLHRVAVTTGEYFRASLDVTEVNGEPAVVLRIDGKLNGVFVLSVADGRITAMRIVRNPEKLRFIDRQFAGSRPV